MLVGNTKCSLKYAMLKTQKNVWALQHNCHPEILHFLFADIDLSITCKELNTAQATKFNKLFQLLKSIFI